MPPLRSVPTLKVLSYSEIEKRLLENTPLEFIQQEINELFICASFIVEEINKTIAKVCKKYTTNSELLTLKFNKYVKKFYFSDIPVHKWKEQSTYSNLSTMHKLEVLHLGKVYNELQDQLAEACRSLKNLREVHIPYQCSDDIVKSLSDNCKFIQILNIECSLNVTDKSVPYLKKMNTLRRLHLYNTKVSLNGVKELLETLNLEFTMTASAIYTSSILPSMKPGTCLNIKKVDIHHINSDLSVLFDFCPKLEQITFNNILLDSNVVDTFDDCISSKLCNITCLKFVGCMAEFVEHVVQKLGKSLIDFEIMRAFQGDVINLNHIAKCCPNLKRMSLSRCDTIINDIFDEYAFENLEYLYWAAYYDEYDEWRCLEYVLSRCENIKNIVIENQIKLPHLFFVKFFNLNSVKHLEHLQIRLLSELAPDTIQLIIDRCGALRSFGTANRLSESVTGLMNIIKKCNYDLNVEFT